MLRPCPCLRAERGSPPPTRVRVRIQVRVRVRETVLASIFSKDSLSSRTCTPFSSAFLISCWSISWLQDSQARREKDSNSVLTNGRSVMLALPASVTCHHRIGQWTSSALIKGLWGMWVCALWGLPTSLMMLFDDDTVPFS